MDLYNYLSVLTSVVLGLGLCHCLTDLSRIVKCRGSIPIVLPQLLWLVLCIILHILYWWAFWGFRNVPEWGFFTYAYVLVGPVLLYLVSDALIEDDFETRRSNADHFFRQHRLIFSGFLSLQLWGILLSPIVLHKPVPGLHAAAQYLFLGISGVGIFTSNKRVHLGLAISGLTVVLAHIVVSRLILAS